MLLGLVECRRRHIAKVHVVRREPGSLLINTVGSIGDNMLLGSLSLGLGLLMSLGLGLLMMVLVLDLRRNNSRCVLCLRLETGGIRIEARELDSAILLLLLLLLLALVATSSLTTLTAIASVAAVIRWRGAWLLVETWWTASSSSIETVAIASGAVVVVVTVVPATIVATAHLLVSSLVAVAASVAAAHAASALVIAPAHGHVHQFGIDGLSNRTKSVFMLAERSIDRSRVTHLVGLAQHLDQIICLIGVGMREQGVGRAPVIGASGTSNAMHIVLRVRRIIIVDHKLDIVNVCFTFDLYFLIVNWKLEKFEKKC